jgi:hypothetical protein
MTRVHVVMKNDYPFAVFSDGVKAASFVAAQPREHDRMPIYWKVYEFTVDER